MDAGARRPLELVYDGDCSLCRAASRLLVRPCLTGDARRRPIGDYDGEVALRLFDAGIHNEMAVLEPTRGEIRSGLDGILWLLRRGRMRTLARLLALPGLRHAVAFGYRMIAYNRRVLAPRSAGAVTCACDPDPRALYQGAFFALSLAFAGAAVLPFVLAGMLAPAAPAAVAGSVALAAALATLWARGPVARPRRLVLLHLAWMAALSSVALHAVAWIDPGAGAPAALVGATLTVLLALRRRHVTGVFGLPSVAFALLLWGLPWAVLHLAGLA